MDTSPRPRHAAPGASGAPDLLDALRRQLDEGEVALADWAVRAGVSVGQLQRRFRARFGATPADYLARRKLDVLKAGLRKGQDVSAALYEAGYGSPSRVYEHGAARLGMTPAVYRAGGRGQDIRWTVLATALGPALVAATARGICAVELGQDADGLEARLRTEFPHAALQRVDAGRDDWLAPRVEAVARRLAGQAAAVEVDLLGSAFQQQVWQALMRIPAGQTRSYAQVAGALGRPRAARAVASACAGNRLAVLVPCHRVIRGDGSAGGYRWGLPLKQALLAREATA